MAKNSMKTSSENFALNILKYLFFNIPKKLSNPSSNDGSNDARTNLSKNFQMNSQRDCWRIFPNSFQRNSARTAKKYSKEIHDNNLEEVWSIPKRIPLINCRKNFGGNFQENCRRSFQKNNRKYNQSKWMKK